AAFRQGAAVGVAPPMMRAACGRLGAMLAAEMGDWKQAREAVDLTLDLLPELVDHGLSPADRRHHLEQLRGLGVTAAHADIADPVDSPGRRAEKAWAGLESGRGVLLGQALEARSDLADLARAYPDLADEVRRLRVLLNRDPMAGHPAAVTD